MRCRLCQTFVVRERKIPAVIRMMVSLATPPLRHCATGFRVRIAGLAACKGIQQVLHHVKNIQYLLHKRSSDI
jgi:hypothetical protein